VTTGTSGGGSAAGAPGAGPSRPTSSTPVGTAATSTGTKPSGSTAAGGPVPGAFGTRRSAHRAAPASSSGFGTPRAGRRAHPIPADQSFLEKYRNRLIGIGIVAGVVLIAAFVFVGANTPVYACSIQLDPASPAPSASVVGQREDDMTRSHVAVGTSVTYTYCPPASGRHYNAQGEGPIAPRFYGPEDTTVPQGWIHNLEHGALVILYNCARAGCDTASLDKLKQVVSNFPASPHCGIAGGLISPVVARFDQMKSNFAALVWDRVLFQDKLDVPQILEFFKNVGETTNPEQQCNPNASGSPVVSGNPASPEPNNPIVVPAPSDSGSVAPSASAAPSST
jgi:hypothetical protein